MDTTFLLTVGGVTSFDDVLQKPAQSILVSNFSNQWVELPGITQFVPPYWVGASFPAEGTNRAVAKFNSPTGIPQAAVIAAQACVIVYMEIAIQPNPGQPVTVRAPSTEWRNPKTLSFGAIVSTAGTTAFVTDWTYTVPAGRRAKIDSIQVMSEISASDGSGAGLEIDAVVVVSPLGGGGVQLVNAVIATGTVVGARADAALASSKDIQATDVVFGAHRNLRSAAVTALTLELCHITEGDA